METATSTSACAQSTHGKPFHSRRFRARNLDIPNRHWVRNDPYATAFFNALSAVFPHGEAFMIESVRPWQKRVPEKLRRDIAAFVEQEAAHSREHIVMNKALHSAGYDIAPLDRAIRQFVAFFSNTGELTKLGATMCIEHLTAIVAAELINNTSHLQGADPEIHKIWLWHGIEEIEHKAVAFDVWMAATAHWSPARRWLVRSALCVAVSTSFIVNRTRGQLELLRQDGVPARRALPGLLRYGFGRKGIGRALLGPWTAFLRPGFHPWQIDDQNLVIKGENMLAALQLVTEGKVNIALTRESSSTLAAVA